MGLQVIHNLSSSQYLNSELFASQINCQNALRTTRAADTYSYLTSSCGVGGLPQNLKRRQRRLFLSVANGDRVVTDYSSKETRIAGKSDLGDGSSVNAAKGNGENRSKVEEASVPQQTEINNGSLASRNEKEEEAAPVNPRPALKRSSSTARDKLRAARVLSRYTESKATKPELGSNLIDALKESEKGKRRPGLPEAPTNMLDDSKRGLSKDGWTFEFPGGFDAFLIAFSFVFISTVMFATTYIVWKVGAIHYNEILSVKVRSFLLRTRV